jgi:hypothetical protein
MVGGIFNSALSEIGRLSDELLRIRKEVTVLGYYPRIQRLKKIMESPS